MAKAKEMTLEETFAKLEEAIEQLEKEDISLEQSFQARIRYLGHAIPAISLLGGGVLQTVRTLYCGEGADAAGDCQREPAISPLPAI